MHEVRAAVAAIEASAGRLTGDRVVLTPVQIDDLTCSLVDDVHRVRLLLDGGAAIHTWGGAR